MAANLKFIPSIVLDPNAGGEVHLARPAYAPTPSPGSVSDDTPPPLPQRQHNLMTSHGGQPQALPYFPYHQFPGRSVKSMCKSNVEILLKPIIHNN